MPRGYKQPILKVKRPVKPKVDPGFTRVPVRTKGFRKPGTPGPGFEAKQALRPGRPAGSSAPPTSGGSPGAGGGKNGKKKGGGGLGGDFYKKWNPLEPLRGKGLKRELNAADRLAHRSLQRQLQAERAGSIRREQTEIPAWYQGYQGDLARLRGEAQGAFDRAAGGIQALSQQTGAQDTAGRQEMMARLQADAAARGGQVESGVEAGNVNAASARQNLLQALQGTVQGQGANQFAYMTNRAATGKLAEGEARGKERQRQFGFDQDARELAQKRGDFRVDFLRTQRENERKYQIERAAAKMDKFGAKTDRFSAKESARHARAGEALDRAEEAGRNQRDRRSQRGQNKRNKADIEAARKKQEDAQAFEKKENKKKRQAEKNQKRKKV